MCPVSVSFASLRKLPAVQVATGCVDEGCFFPTGKPRLCRSAGHREQQELTALCSPPACSWGPTPGSALHLLSGSAGTTVQLMGSEMTQKHNGHK